MGSANQVPYSLAGNCARDIRRGVLVLAADLCTIISQVLLTRCSVSFRQCAVCRVRCGLRLPRRSERSCWPWRLLRHARAFVPAVTSAICLPVLGGTWFVGRATSYRRRAVIVCIDHPFTARQGIAEQCPEREGQRSKPRKQAGHMTASDKCTNLIKNVLLCRSHPHKTFAACAKKHLPDL